MSTALISFLFTIVATVIGFAVRWWWTNRKRDKRILELEEEKRADIKIHQKIDERNAKQINPPSASDNSKWL